MRRAALVVALFVTFASTAAIRPDRSAAQQQAGADGQDRHDPAARDVPYPGTMQLTVDASDVTRAIFRIHRARPGSGCRRFRPALPQVGSGRAQPARTTSRTSPASGASANGRELKWVRDNLDVYAFHIDVPAGRQVDRRRLSNMSRRRPTTRGASWPPRTWRASSGSSNSHVSGRLFRPRRSRCRRR